MPALVAGISIHMARPCRLNRDCRTKSAMTRSHPSRSGVCGDPGGISLHEACKKLTRSFVGKFAVCVKELVGVSEVSLWRRHGRNI